MVVKTQNKQNLGYQKCTQNVKSARSIHFWLVASIWIVRAPLRGYVFSKAPKYVLHLDWKFSKPPHLSNEKLKIDILGRLFDILLFHNSVFWWHFFACSHWNKKPLSLLIWRINSFLIGTLSSSQTQLAVYCTIEKFIAFVPIKNVVHPLDDLILCRSIYRSLIF